MDRHAEDRRQAQMNRRRKSRHNHYPDPLSPSHVEAAISKESHVASSSLSGIAMMASLSTHSACRQFMPRENQRRLLELL
eukprot:5769005-Pleurochrysis_carterae.AAC.1